MKLTLCSYRDELQPAFAQLNLQWIREHFKIERKDVEMTSDPRSTILNQGGEVLFLMQNNQVAGSCAILKVDADLYEIAKLAVEKTFRGQGLGHHLMEAAERWIASVGGKKVLLLSNTSLAPALALYQSRGYRTVHLGQHPDYDRCNIVLEKSVVTNATV